VPEQPPPDDLTGLTLCPGCGLLLPAADGPTHSYIGASAACWALYGQVLAIEAGTYRQPAWHRLTVDAYAVQHPGIPERRSIQSVCVHLISLCLMLEHDISPAVPRGCSVPFWRVVRRSFGLSRRRQVD